jgi:hypothetical protein
MRVELYTMEGCDESGCCLDCEVVEEQVSRVMKAIKPKAEWEFIHQQCSKDTCCPEVPCLAADGKILLSGSGWREEEIRTAIKKQMKEGKKRA